ncbi:hypothetical protein DM02DRAFT_635016 [Periconia macrospinosa]|uniref:Uncharacterized protein n=1 Tax=Periconia macrospinosa TaxID=97972 RepID=A0A2V1D4F6_9PLEO|nr:hypothetical protein DM02DRAFT_635016 [Periconia macrospinosa]
MSILRDHEKEVDRGTTLIRAVHPMTPENDEDDTPRASRSHTPYSGTPTPPHLEIPEIVEPPVPNPSPEPGLFGYGYAYPYAMPPPRWRNYEACQRASLPIRSSQASPRPAATVSITGNYEYYKHAMQSGIIPTPSTEPKTGNYEACKRGHPVSPLPSSPALRPQYRTYVPHATLGSELDIAACVDRLEGIASQAEAQYSQENQRRMWHVAALGIGVRKVGDTFGFSSTGASRSVTPVGWPQGGITGRKRPEETDVRERR